MVLLIGVVSSAAAFQTTNHLATKSVTRSPPFLASSVLLLKEKHNNHDSSTTTTTTTTTTTRTTSRLMAASSSTQEPPEIQLDTSALIKYGSSIAIQMSLITALFAGVDVATNALGLEDGLPFLAVLPIFYGLSLKSRTFNPLNNQRPNRDQALQKEGETQGFRDRVMPSWTPPGVTFPIMWVLIIGPIRAYTSALVYQSNGHHLCDLTILALMLHLSMGDVWNTINNVEKRYGAAVPSVLVVSLLAANAAYQYYQVDTLAGSLLGATLLWFTVASTLIADTWRLNPDPLTQQRDPLYPTIVEGEESVTQFAWFD